jgi:hypothetical protein
VKYKYRHRVGNCPGHDIKKKNDLKKNECLHECDTLEACKSVQHTRLNKIHTKCILKKRTCAKPARKGDRKYNQYDKIVCHKGTMLKKGKCVKIGKYLGNWPYVIIHIQENLGPYVAPSTYAHPHQEDLPRKICSVFDFEFGKVHCLKWVHGSLFNIAVPMTSHYAKILDDGRMGLK